MIKQVKNVHVHTSPYLGPRYPMVQNQLTDCLVMMVQHPCIKIAGSSDLIGNAIKASLSRQRETHLVVVPF